MKMALIGSGVLCVVTGFGAEALGAISFTRLDGMVQGSGISSDGRVVVGVGSGQNRSAYWTRANGVRVVPGAAGTLGGGSANGVSPDGEWIVGSVRVPVGSSFGLAAYRWSTGTAMQVLPDQPGGVSSANYVAQAVSNGGGVVAGYGDIGSTLLSFSYTSADDTTRTLPQFSPSPYSTINQGMSADGTKFFGGARLGTGFVAFRSTMAGVQRLPGLNPGTSALPFQDYATDASDDGRFATGWSVLGALDNLQFRAILWDGLTPRTLGSQTARAYGVSNQGETVVGSLGVGDSAAMIWTADLGMRDLRAYLVGDLGLGAQLSGWTLTRAAAVSGDGKTITGWGTRNGQQAGFVVVVPEPASLGLVASLLPVMLRPRRN